MKRLHLITLLGLAALLLAAGLLAAAPPARAQVNTDPSTSYSLTWYTVDGGGTSSSGGGYSLTGTAGQPDAGTLTSPGYNLRGGFWASLGHALQKLFLPLVRR